MLYENMKDEMTQKIAIQDTYGERFRHCWGCGSQNEDGLHIKSYPEGEGRICVCRLKPSTQFTGGVPQNLFGGLIATVFDCHGTASAAWFAHRERGLTLNSETIIHRYITARLEIDFQKPVPIEEEITVTAQVEEIGERKVIVRMELEACGEVRAKARMVAVRVKEHM